MTLRELKAALDKAPDEALDQYVLVSFDEGECHMLSYVEALRFKRGDEIQPWKVVLVYDPNLREKRYPEDDRRKWLS